MPYDDGFNMSDARDSHLKRFHGDPETNLTGYAVFHGDDRMPGGEPLPTGTLPSQMRSTSHVPAFQDFGDTYEVRTGVPLAPHRGALATASMPYPSPSDSKKLTGTAIPYTSGTFVAESGLPPTQYKAWTSEYRDEFRTPEELADNLDTLTMQHGTQNALHDSQFQFKGYPLNSKTYSRSSLTAKGQIAPDYESRVVGF
eukprot:gene32140-16665_t